MVRRALLLVSMSACLDGPGRSLREGNLAARDGRLAEARTAFERAVALQPADPRAHVLLGNTLLALGRPGEARAEFTAALDRDPRSAGASLGLAALAVADHQPTAALGLLAAVPRTPAARLLTARAYLARGEPRDSEAALAELTGASSPEARYLTASALLVEGRFGEAQTTLQSLEAASPSLARYGLARLAAAQGRPTDTVMYLSAAKAALGPRWDAAAVAADPAFDFVRDAPELQPTPKPQPP